MVDDQAYMLQKAGLNARAAGDFHEAHAHKILAKFEAAEFPIVSGVPNHLIASMACMAGI